MALESSFVRSLRDDIVIHNPKYQILKTIATLMADVNASCNFTVNPEFTTSFSRTFFSDIVNFDEIQNDPEYNRQYIECCDLMLEKFPEFETDEIKEILEENVFQFDDTINVIYNRIMLNCDMYMREDLRESFHFKWMLARYLSTTFVLVFRVYMAHHITEIHNHIHDIENTSRIVRNVRSTIMCPDFRNISIIYPVRGLHTRGFGNQLTTFINLHFNYEFHQFVKTNLIGNSHICPSDFEKQEELFNNSLVENRLRLNIH